MPERFTSSPPATPKDHRLLTILLVLPLLASLAAVWVLDHAKAHRSLFSMTNMVGPTTKSLLDGDGLTVCTEDMGTPGNPICFHAAHMPINAFVVALGVRLLGDRYVPVVLFKTILLLLPLQLAIYLVWRRLLSRGTFRSQWKAITAVLLLLAPFAIPTFLADVANILVEEGFSYSFLALAVALLFFGRSPANPQSHPGAWREALLFGIVLAGLYLSKSSMLPAVIVLTISFFLLERATGPRLLVAVLVAAAPLGWAVYQHHASARYSIGTSLDGINLHKGNNEDFLMHYPPPPGESLDRFDSVLNRGLRFNDEWSFNDYHRHAALTFLWTHPQATLQGAARKLQVLFLSVKKYGSTAPHGVTRAMEDIGMTIFRLMLWTAIGCSVYVLFRPTPGGRSLRLAAGTFLALVAACALPYLAGFPYTRHVSILIYPAALMCCRLLVRYDPTFPAL